jgi:hypothetical protein
MSGNLMLLEHGHRNPQRVAPTAIDVTDGNLLPHPRHANSKV